MQYVSNTYKQYGNSPTNTYFIYCSILSINCTISTNLVFLVPVPIFLSYFSLVLIIRRLIFDICGRSILRRKRGKEMRRDPRSGSLRRCNEIFPH